MISKFAAAFIASAACATVAVSGAASAQSVAEFYKGKTLVLYSGHSAAGAYSAYARLLELHIGKHIPGNPTTVMKIMEGGTGLTLANWLYNIGPKDGLAFGIFHERMGLEPVVAPRGTQFDGRKFTWIGSMAKQTSVCFTWHGSKVKSVADAKAMSIPVGASAAAASDSVMPRMMNAMLGTKFQIIRGYGGSDIMLAIERGEVEGRCGFGWASMKTTRPDWYKDGKINLIAQFSFKPHPDLPNVPVMMDLVDKLEDKQALELIFATQEMGRPFAAPPACRPTAPPPCATPSRRRPRTRLCSPMPRSKTSRSRRSAARRSPICWCGSMTRPRRWSSGSKPSAPAAPARRMSARRNSRQPPSHLSAYRGRPGDSGPAVFLCRAPRP